MGVRRTLLIGLCMLLPACGPTPTPAQVAFGEKCPTFKEYLFWSRMGLAPEPDARLSQLLDSALNPCATFKSVAYQMQHGIGAVDPDEED